MLDKVRGLFPRKSVKYGKRLGDISGVDYVKLEDYKQDILDIDNELREIELTIDYFKDRRKILNVWKHSIEVKIDKWNELNICENCKYCHNLYCNKFDFKVDGEATCEEFLWK